MDLVPEVSRSQMIPRPQHSGAPPRRGRFGRAAGRPWQAGREAKNGARVVGIYGLAKLAESLKRCCRACSDASALSVEEERMNNVVKEGVVIIDVGITRVADPSKKSGYALRGDVAYDEVAPRCRAITPVPGGVGPMTRAGLLLNTLSAARGEVYG